MPDEDTSSRYKFCPMLRLWCGPLVTVSADEHAMHKLPCAWWDAALDTCCVRAIADLMHSVYGKDEG